MLSLDEDLVLVKVNYVQLPLTPRKRAFSFIFNDKLNK